MKTRGLQRRTRSLYFAAVLMLGACKSASPPAVQRLNLLLVTIDTLRADRVGCYGYSKVETPNLDKIARQGVLFENAVAPAPLTAPSHASMMTGLYPTAHKVRNTGGFVLSASDTTLAKLLQDQGWDTAAFVGSSVLKRRFGFNQGFSVYDDEMPTLTKGSAQVEPERRASEVVDRAVKWLEAQSGKPYFLWVHVYDPHIPYDPPSPFREKYAERPYDGEIAYTDQQLGRLFDSAARKSPNTLTAVLSDHGESFSEHGEYTHGVFLYDTTLRIPLLLAGGAVPAGVRVKRQARTIDLLPTLAELVGVKAPAGVQGTSLVPTFRGNDVDTVFSYSETFFPKLNMGWAELRAMRTNRWKYIRAPKPELYDVAEDPGETTNVIASHAAEVQGLEAKMKAISSTTEKVAPAAMDPRTLQQLRSLGYLSGSTTQSTEVTGEGIDPKDRLEVLRLLHMAVHSGAPQPARISMLRQAIARDPANPSLYNYLGNLYSEAGRQAEAMKLYQDAIHKGVRSAWVYSRLGNLTLRQGNKADAIMLFEAATQLNPSDYESLQNLAVAYREGGRVADCERVLKQILQSGEEYAPAYNELGMTAFQKGDGAAARTYFEKAAGLDPTYQLNLGRFYKMMGDNGRARTAFEAFLAARASNDEYRKMIPEVRKELASVQ